MERLVTVIGAGGKTTLINYLGKMYALSGKRVLITTTTKMYIPTDMHLFQSCDEIISFLENVKNGIVIAAGIPCGEGKFSELSGQWLNKIKDYVDIILVEGDGSKRLPLKLPGEGEPIIPKGCNSLYIVGGAFAIGKPIEEVCHRAEIVSKYLSKKTSDIVAAEDFCKVLCEYEDIISKAYSADNIYIVVSQMQEDDVKEEIQKYFDGLNKENVLYLWRVAEDDYVLRDSK